MALDRLRNELKKNGVALLPEQEERFRRFSAMLKERSKVMNLTAVKDPAEYETRHFLDSLSPLLLAPARFQTQEGDPKKTAPYIADLGTGAGFPGVPLAIMLPHCEFVLMDSLNKRISFLEDVISELRLDNVRVACGRFEEIARKAEYRERFDIVLSRAVAEMRVLVEYALPLIKVGGALMSYKGEGVREEIEASEAALRVLAGEVQSLVAYSDACSHRQRSLVVISKRAPVDNRYPRRTGVPSKRPL